ncbi:MAG: N-acetylmuramoyl-L-alanine amidase [Bacteroidota bacterium]
MRLNFILISLLFIFLSACMNESSSNNKYNVLKNKVICLDPGHGGTAGIDSFRVGKNGEREEWINLRVALILADMLKESGAKVILTRSKDVQVPLKERAMLAVENKADVFISIHHNGVTDTTVNFPTVYFHASAKENMAGVQLAKILGKYFSEYLFNNKAPVAIVSDYMIYPGSGTSVLRNTYGIPAVIGEASYFTNPIEEQKLKDSLYNREEAKVYIMALNDFFSSQKLPVKEKDTLNVIEKLPVNAFENRKGDEMLNWLGNYNEAVKLYKQQKYEAAADLFWKSALFFPDSYVAGDCHNYLSKIYAEKDPQLAETERRRYEEFFVKIKE